MSEVLRTLEEEEPASNPAGRVLRMVDKAARRVPQRPWLPEGTGGRCAPFLSCIRGVILVLTCSQRRRSRSREGQRQPSRGQRARFPAPPHLQAPAQTQVEFLPSQARRHCPPSSSWYRPGPVGTRPSGRPARFAQLSWAPAGGRHAQEPRGSHLPPQGTSAAHLSSSCLSGCLGLQLQRAGPRWAFGAPPAWRAPAASRPDAGARAPRSSPAGTAETPTCDSVIPRSP